MFLSGRRCRRFTAWLNHPRIYTPLWGWVAVAVVTFALHGVVAYRLIEHGEPTLGRLSLLALAVVMGANVAYNFVLDRTRNPSWAYYGLLWLLPLLIVFQLLLFLSEPVSALLNLSYVAWVVFYDLPIMRALARLSS